MKDTLVQIYLFGGAAALGGVLFLLAYAVRWAANKVPFDAARRVILTAWDTVALVTREANAEFQAKLELATDEDSPGGKEITKEEWDAAKTAAIAKFKQLYGFGNLKKLVAALGLDLPEKLESWIGSAITSQMKVPLKSGLLLDSTESNP